MMNEKEFVLEICKFMCPDKEKIGILMNENLDYSYILGQLLYNRVGGPAYYTLERLSLCGGLNREFWNSIKTIYETNKWKNDSFRRAKKVLGDILRSADFNYALLKGAYLSEIYPDGLRTSNDIDILISEKDIGNISDLLLSNGFSQGHIRGDEFIPASRMQIISSRMNRGETVPFVMEINQPFMKYLEVDINFSLDFKPEVDKKMVERLLDHTITMKSGLKTLAHSDFLIHLCVHLFKEATVYNWIEFGRDQGLYKYLDIFLCREWFDPDRIRQLELEKECFYALYGMNALFGEGFDMTSIQPTDLSYLNQMIIPGSNRKYAYDLSFIDWVFETKRNDFLYEINA